MTDPSAFNSNDNPQATPESQPAPQSAFVDQLKMIKNEAGEQKYEDLPKALDALAHSQAYIPQLKTELSSKDAEIAKLQEELAKRSAVEDVVEKLTARQDQPEATPQASGLDEQKVAELFNQMTAQQQQSQTAALNEKSVSDALFKKFGDSTGQAVASKAQELGMTVEGLKQLSQSSPSAALQLFQLSSGAKPPAPSSGSVNIPPLATPEDTLARPEKSLLRGASTKEQVDYLRKIKSQVYNKFEIES